MCTMYTYIHVYIYIYQLQPIQIGSCVLLSCYPKSDRRHDFEHNLFRTFSVMGMKPLTCFVMEPMHFLVNNTLHIILIPEKLRHAVACLALFPARPQ